MKSDRLSIRNPNDVVIVRRVVRERSLSLGFGLIDLTKIVTAASELARNTLEYGHGGEVDIEELENERGRLGIKMTFTDQGPGIADLKLALTDGFTSGSGMGMGLPGSKRLMSELTIDSVIGKGTRVIAIKWK